MLWLCVLVVASLVRVMYLSLLLCAASHGVLIFFFFLMIRRPPRSTLDRSSAASDVYKRQLLDRLELVAFGDEPPQFLQLFARQIQGIASVVDLSLIHISEPTRPY